VVLQRERASTGARTLAGRERERPSLSQQVMGPGLPFGLASAPGTLLPSARLQAAGDSGCTGETWVVDVDDVLVLPTPGPTTLGTEVADQSAEAEDAIEGTTVTRRQ